MMAALSMENLGDVEEECYRNLKPGVHILLWYSDDTVWHEAMIAYVVGDTRAVIYTPDADLYIEDIGCNGEGPVKMKGMVENRKLPRNLRARAYRFKGRFTDSDLRQIFRDGISAATDAGETIVYPKTVVNSAGEEVSFSSFFGGEFLRHRATVKGPPGGDGTGGSPDSPKNAARAKPAPENYVWVASEPLGGLRLGQEIVLNSTSDVQVGEKVAMTLRSGVWVRADLVTLEEATTFAEMRRGLFAGPPAAASDSKRNAQPKEEETGDSQDHHGDARTLWIDIDEHGERYKRWRDVCKECFTPVFDEKPLEGPATSLHLIKVTERQGGDPRLWLQGWMRQKKMEPTDRTAHELKVLCDCLYYAGVYDQVNIPALISLEIVARRIQAIADAYTNPNKPSWENAKIFTGQGTADDVVSPTFRTYAVRKNKDELELLQARQKVRELRGSPAITASDDVTGDGVNDALPPKPRKPPRGRGRGGGQENA